MILNTLPPHNLLIDAYKFYSREDARAHDAINIIIDKNAMTEAVLKCIEQALEEEEPSKQNLYIQAAGFGKKFHPGIAIEEYTRACRLLRVKNTCRAEGVDPTLSIAEIVDCFLERREFARALWIVEWMREDGEQKVRAKWSEHMIEQRTLTDEQVAEKIQLILGDNPVVPYADIASKAIEHNRIRSAIRLIEKETHSSKQIPLLLNLKQYDLVLAQALSTCDSNLVYMAIFKLRESMPSEITFIELLKKHRPAFKYYCNYLAAVDIPKLIMISHRENLDDELTLCLLDNRLESALMVSKRAHLTAVSQQIETSMRLSKFQSTLERHGAPPKAKNGAWTELSISDTIINLVAIGKTNLAKDCQKNFDVSDKKYRVLEQIALNKLPKLSIPANN